LRSEATATVAVAQGGGGGGGGGGISDGGSGGGNVDPSALAVFVAVVLGMGAYSIYQGGTEVTNTINFVLILRNGADYVEAINQLTLRAEFQTDQGRQNFLKQLATLLNPNDVIDGFLRVRSSKNAYQLWQRQKQAAEIQDLVINVSPSNQTPTAWDKSPANPESTSEADTYCIVGIILENSTPNQTATRELGELRIALPKLSDWLKSNGDFYYYFGPTTTGVSLSEAQRLLTKVLQGP
jgi:hypothetical protein